MSSIRVLIVADAAHERDLLSCMLRQDERLEVGSMAASAEEALHLLDRVCPDVILLDVRLPAMNGLEAIRRIMATRPTPIVILSAGIESTDLNILTTAMQAGALSVLEKPGVVDPLDTVLRERVCDQLVIMSQVQVIRQHGKRYRIAPISNAPCKAVHSGVYAMVGIASSTGGPGALGELLSALGPGFPIPILLVQHLAPGFLGSFARWLSAVSPFSVVVVDGSEVPCAGKVYMAIDNQHLHAAANLLWTEASNPVSSHRPSGTVLFQSMARSQPFRSIGIVLSGMGDDGAVGLLELREAGGFTIAQDEATAVVSSMPNAASRAGAICERLPLPSIAPRLLELVAATGR